MSYDVVGLLGRGGTAVVELAIDGSGRRVATKRLALTGSGRQIQVARQRLRREAEILASLAHSGIVPILDVVDDGTEVVLVFPALAESLDDRVARLGPLPPAEVARIGRVLIDALAAAHRQGVVHRDLKPANVLFDHLGRPALADFGVAVTRELTAGLTLAGTVIGTPMWMAPEQARGDVAGPPSDVFSLAATLTFAATGQGPYGSGDPQAVLGRAARAEVRPVPAEVPSVLRRPLECMLDPDPLSRPSAAAVLGGLRDTAVAVVPVAPLTPAPRPGAARRWCRGGGRARRALLAVAVTAAIGLVAAVVVAGLRAGPDSRTGASGAPRGGGAATCTPLAYQPCGHTAAPHTNGRGCLPGWYDLNSDAADGCEARSDYVAGTDLGGGTPVRANLVPAGTTDTFSTRVDGSFLSLCWGSLGVTLTAPAGTADRVSVAHDGRQVAEALSADGTPATARVAKPSCLGDDSETLQVKVGAVAGSPSAGAQDFVLTRSGGW